MESTAKQTREEPRPAAGGGFKIRGLRWWVAGMLTLITVVNYLDRTALGAVAPILKKDLAIDEESFSYIVMAFQVVYAFMQPVAGRIIDWLNIRVGFALALGWWSVAQAITGFATGWKSLAIFRGVLGVGEAGNFPGAIKTVSQWFPPKERTIATGIFNMGSAVGSAISGPLVAFLLVHHSWRAVFVVTGLIGLALVVGWVAFYRAPEQHPLLSAEELAHIRQGEAEAPTPAAAGPKEKGVWRAVVLQRNFWGLAFARFLSEPAWQLFSYWIPLYLVTERHLDIKKAALYLVVPFLASDLGSLFGGVLSPFFIGRGHAVLTARKLAMTVPAVLMMLAVFTGTAPSVNLAIFFFSVGTFAHQAISATLLTLPADLFPKRTVATANGLSGTAGYLGGLLFTFIIGKVAKSIGYGPLFVAIGFFDIIGAVFLWTMVRSPREDAAPAKAA